ncbi:YceI family protein [Streptomyces sp. NPDC055952]|uniref:YceI family protein n=1 Tax=Streptomyces sp. NPDC055952 TaxID=3345663 RepID=UPI0035D642FF
MAASRPRSSPAPGLFEIDPTASTVRFDTRAVFGLIPVRGTFDVTHGQIIVADPVAQSSVHVVLQAGSFATGNRQRDDHVRSPDYLDAARHPEIAFRSMRVVGAGTDHANVHGELTVCGVTHPIALALGPVVQDDERLTASAGTTVDRYAFGLTKAKGMTGRRLRMTLKVVAYHREPLERASDEAGARGG